MVVAEFYTIETVVQNTGTIIPWHPSSNRLQVPYGGSAAFEIQAGTGYHVSYVQVYNPYPYLYQAYHPNLGPLDSYEFTDVKQNYVIYARFDGDKSGEYSIVAFAGVGGTISSQGLHWVTEHGSTPRDIKANPGYHISGIVIDGVSVAIEPGITDYTHTFPDVTRNSVITATFERNAHSILATATGNGSLVPSDEAPIINGDRGVVVPHGGSRSFTIIPDENWYINELLIDGGPVNTRGIYEFTNVTTDDRSIDVSFAENTYETHEITATAGSGGDIYPSGKVPVTIEGDMRFTITPDAGFKISDVIVDGTSKGAVDIYTFENVTFEEHTIHATFELIPDTPPPPPPVVPSGDLSIYKTFSGLTANVDIFNINAVSPITFLVIGTNAANVEIFRQTVEFSSANFSWDASQGRYVFLLTDLPLGDYRVYERGGHVDGYELDIPEDPQLATLATSGTHVSVSHVNSYIYSPVLLDDLPALTMRKVFHGLTNSEIPSDFQIRVTGPENLDRLVSVSQAVAGYTLKNLTPGDYTITEVNNDVPKFNMTVAVNNQSETLPYDFTIADETTHLTLTVDNYYTPIEPPQPPQPPQPPVEPPIASPQPPAEPQFRSPQTSNVRNLAMPIIALVLGALLICGAEIYRRKLKKKAKKD
jgi:hypothetical protein